MPNARITGSGIRSPGPPISKFCKELEILSVDDTIKILTLLTVVSEHPSNGPLALEVHRMYRVLYEIFAVTYQKMNVLEYRQRERSSRRTPLGTSPVDLTLVSGSTNTHQRY
jgi:hypothetical protein